MNATQTHTWAQTETAEYQHSGLDQYDREDAEFALLLTDDPEVVMGMTPLERYGLATLVLAYLAA